MNDSKESCAAHEGCTCSHPCGADAAPPVADGTPAADVQAACLRNLLDTADKLAQSYLLLMRVSEKTLPISPGELPVFAMMARADHEKDRACSIIAAFGAVLALVAEAEAVRLELTVDEADKIRALTYLFDRPKVG